ncbi:hypothetical protein IWW48_000185 [Coemansia sp. RSA 1200]|nr:hypothetical protein IWW48_000185 [Coemansia sp. RSA 1200]
MNNLNFNAAAMQAPNSGAASGLNMLNFGYLSQPAAVDGLGGAAAYPAPVGMLSPTSAAPVAAPPSAVAQRPLGSQRSSSAAAAAAAQAMAASTPLIPPQLLLANAGSWGLVSQQQQQPSLSSSDGPSVGIAPQSLLLHHQHQHQQQQSHAAGNNFLAHISSLQSQPHPQQQSPPQLQSQPLQGSALAALASNPALQGIGPHQAHYIMMMHQQQQQQHLNGTIASASPMIQHAHPAAPATASALKTPQQQQQQLQQQQLRQQQQQYAQSKDQKKPQFSPTPVQKSSLPPPLPQSSTVPAITDTPLSSASAPVPAQSAEPSPLVPPLPATAPTQAPVPVPGSREAGSASPAPSTETRKSRSSPRPPRRTTKESKRKHPAARRDGVSATAAKAGGAPAKQAQTTSSPPQLPQKPADSEPAAVMEPIAMPRARSFQKSLPRWPQSDAVLGAGTERLLAFHSALGPSGETRDLDHWISAISSSFAQGGTIRMEIGGQSYDMPAATAGRFYHRLFGDGGVVSIHVALSSAQVHMLGNAASIVSFHGVLLTTAYANGRRVLEAGDLRVIFDPRFRIRVWAFSCADATVCLPRKRPNGADDALARSSDATIARNLDWPDTSPAPAPKRRKSAHGRQPPDECAIPACALQHLEIANTMGLLRDLISTQAMHPAAPSADVLALWKLSRARDPAMLLALAPSPATPSTAVAAATASVERKRARRRSVATAAAKDAKSAGARSAGSPAPKEAPTTPVRKQRATPAHQTKPGSGARK